MIAEPAIQARELTRVFGAFTAVDHITFDVRVGEVFGFLGANGAGKTTAMRMLIGLLAPSSGTAKVAGFDVYTESEAIKRSIGYMSQRFSLYEDLTPRENIRLYGGIYGLTLQQIRERTDRMITRLGLTSVANEQVRSLPLGWRQKLAFSVALVHEPRIVFLDEPTSGVDPITRRQFWELIYEAASAGTTVLVSTHYMDEAEYCGRISIMVAGRIGAIGTPSELKQQFGVDSIDELFVRLARPETAGAWTVRAVALLGLLRKEVYHILRDRRTLVVIIAMPVLQVIIFGYAIRTDVDHVRLAIVDPAPDDATLALRSRFTAAGVFTLVAVESRVDALERLFQRGEAQAAIVFDPDFAEHLARGLPAGLQIIADATEPNTGSIVAAYAQAVVQGYEQEADAAPRTPHLAPLQPRGAVRIVPSIRMRFNPTRESSNLFVPGLMAFVLTIISSLMTAISLTREKETGTMEALLVSPLRPWEIIVGKVAPYLAVGFISVVLVIVEARLVFNVPLRGSVVLLLVESLLFILVSLSLGILVSARTSSQRVAMLGALVGTMLPTMLLSGFIFPIESMPAPLRAASNIVPARWFVLVARSIMLKGVGLDYLWKETLVVVAMALILLTMSTRSFHERLE